MALKNRKYNDQKLIHHSDRGLQYCNSEFTGFAEDNGLTMNMTQQYDPYENPVAERINQTLKYEYELRQTIKKHHFSKEDGKKGCSHLQQTSTFRSQNELA